MQLLQSGMKERGNTMAKVVITYNQKMHCVAHVVFMHLCAEKNSDVCSFLFLFHSPSSNTVVYCAA